MNAANLCEDIVSRTLSTSGRSYEELENWLIDVFARLANLAPADIDIERAFVDFELDSSVAVTLADQLSRWCGVELNATVFWELPTIRELAASLAAPE